MIFGNSRGSHPVDRSMQDEWYSYMEQAGFDGYGYHDLSDERGVFENEVFRLQPYYWGDCECGFEERDWQWSKEHRHSGECYQSELRREKIAAGGKPGGEWGWIERPKSLSYDQWNKIERDIYNRLCAKHGLDPKFGCAVHCTCTHDSDYQAWREQNDHAPDCMTVMPNFTHKPSGFTLQWYKYPLRDSYSSAPLTPELMRSMWADCLASMAASGTPTRRAETTGSVGEADGGPTAEGGDAQQGLDR
jgi:hypothetical protein